MGRVISIKNVLSLMIHTINFAISKCRKKTLAYPNSYCPNHTIVTIEGTL